MDSKISQLHSEIHVWQAVTIAPKWVTTKAMIFKTSDYGYHSGWLEDGDVNKDVWLLAGSL